MYYILNVTGVYLYLLKMFANCLQIFSHGIALYGHCNTEIVAHPG